MDSLKIPKGSSSSANSSPKTSNSNVRFISGEEEVVTATITSVGNIVDDLFKASSSSSNHNNSIGVKSNSPSPSAAMNSSSGSAGGVTVGGITINNDNNLEGLRPDIDNVVIVSCGESVHSLSSSPSQSLHQISNDDNSMKNNFLQGNFFNRKRSGSIEGISPTSIGPNLLAALSSGTGGNSATENTSTGGTWKMIKGKVSQTLEDIKSSKAPQQYPMTATYSKNGHSQPQGLLNEPPDSEDENKFVVIRTNNEDYPISLELKSLPLPPSPQRQPHKIDSESEFDHEILLETDFEPSRLKRGLANLKSKVKSTKSNTQQQNTTQQQQLSPQQQQASTQIVKTIKKETSTMQASGTNSLRSAFLGRRRRIKQAVETAELASPSNLNTATLISTTTTTSIGVKNNNITKNKKDIEIETGVEMLEDMLSQSHTTADRLEGGSDISLKLQKPGLPTNCTKCVDPDLPDTLDENETQQHCDDIQFSKSYGSDNEDKPRNLMEHLTYCFKNFPYIILLTMFLVLIFPMREFIRGVLMCLLTIALLDSIWSIIQCAIECFIIDVTPEKRNFQIPDYSKMPIVEIPAVEEHKSVKTYKGFMNEIDSYDVNSYHISMTKVVYVKLEGATLHISSTTARIPKRAMWNEPHIDRKNMVYTDHRTYNLLGCRIELLPIGLARKRFFNRKYPIQLIVKNSGLNAVPSTVSFKRPSTASSHDNLPTVMTTSTTGSNKNDETNDKSNEMHEESDIDLEAIAEIDFGTTILNTDLAVLQESMNPDLELQDLTIPCGDETRLLLFARTDREKEDWYRRFQYASLGLINEKELNIANIRLVDDHDLQATTSRATAFDSNSTTTIKSDGNEQDKDLHQIELKGSDQHISNSTPDQEGFEDVTEDNDLDTQQGASVEGLLMTWCVGRNPRDYVQFMTLYQKACKQRKISVYKGPELINEETNHRRRRSERKKSELWKGIDQSLFLGPSGSVVWANVLIGRVFFSCLNDSNIINKVQELIQRKLATVRLPSFMEEVVITQINLGKTPPLIHRVSQPMLDERGVWVDADCTFEGLVQVTITTKLNLLRLKKQSRAAPTTATEMNNPATAAAAASATIVPNLLSTPNAANVAGSNIIHKLDNASSSATTQWLPIPSEDQLSGDLNIQNTLSSSAIYDSDAESSGCSSSESESVGPSTSNNNLTTADNLNANEQKTVNASPGNARRIFKIVDRITASNFFQYATELSYVQRAMENMNANITLRIDIKGCVGRAVLNIPPPPSDRIWISFRGPPRLWLTAKPTVGDKSMDWSIVTNVIESKLCELVNKHLVYPNMIDFTISLLGHPTYNLPTD